MPAAPRTNWRAAYPQAPARRGLCTPAIRNTTPIAHITLSGEVPTGARQLSWRYGWTFASYALVLRRADGASETQWIEGGDGSAPLALTAALPAARPLATFVQYLQLGFTHIFPNGIDHILFVVGLFLLSTNWRTLLWQVSAFTTAHTITLGLAMTGLIAVRPSIVEPLIAVSIAYVAVENVLCARLRPSRVVLVFVFGLLHGLGFAGVLNELGLPHREFAPAPRRLQSWRRRRAVVRHRGRQPGRGMVAVRAVLPAARRGSGVSRHRLHRGVLDDSAPRLLNR